MFINNLTGELHMTEEILFECPICKKPIALRMYVNNATYIKIGNCEHYRCIVMPVCRGFWESFNDIVNRPYIEGLFYEYSGFAPQNAVLIINKKLERQYFEELRRMVFG